MCFHTTDKVSMAHASCSGCHEIIFRSHFLILPASRSQSWVPNTFMIFYTFKTAKLSSHSIPSSRCLNISLVVHFSNLVYARLRSIDCSLCTIPRFSLRMNFNLCTSGVLCDYGERLLLSYLA